MVITLFQQDIIWADAEANRNKVERILCDATQSDIFVVPETFTTGFGNHMAALAEEFNGPTLRWAQRMAAKHNCLFVGTWVVRVDGHCYNRLHWVYPDGSFGSYDKGHTFRVSGEADQIARGTRREMFEWRGWRIKPAICYDLRFPKWLRNKSEYSEYSEKKLDYDLLLVCANWPGSRHEAWTTLLKARAIENLCYVAGCNRVGTDNHGSNYSGNSALVDYKGTTLLEASGETIITATIDKQDLNGFRERWPFYLDFD